MALDVPYGGHISHAKVSAAGIAGLKTISQPFDKEVMNIDIDPLNHSYEQVRTRVQSFCEML